MKAPPHEPAEGAIRFSFELTPARATDSLPQDQLRGLAAWRDILRHLKLLGRDVRRYDGYHYGNLSVRDPTCATRFFITASQTSGRRRLSAQQIVRIDTWNVQRFALAATGAAPPSSESISHAMLYAADPTIGWVMHVHSASIWRCAARLRLPCIAADIVYGSPAMAVAIGDLLMQRRERPLVFATLGHHDGVFAAGADAAATGSALVRTLAQSLEQRP